MKFSFFIGLISSLLILSSCGGDNKSSKVKIAIIPDTPIVFTGDITLPIPGSSETETITGPWFRFRYKIDNETEADIVTVVGIEAVVVDAANSSKTSSFDPGEIGRTVFIELATGGSFTDPINFYVQGLTESTSLRYKVAITFNGWFGTENEPLERFRKTINVNTE